MRDVASAEEGQTEARVSGEPPVAADCVLPVSKRPRLREKTPCSTTTTATAKSKILVQHEKSISQYLVRTPGLKVNGSQSKAFKYADGKSEACGFQSVWAEGGARHGLGGSVER